MSMSTTILLSPLASSGSKSLVGICQRVWPFYLSATRRAPTLDAFSCVFCSSCLIECSSLSLPPSPPPRPFSHSIFSLSSFSASLTIRPKRGNELVNKVLAAALVQKVHFNQEEFDHLNIDPKELTASSYVKAGAIRMAQSICFLRALRRAQLVMEAALLMKRPSCTLDN